VTGSIIAGMVIEMNEAKLATLDLSAHQN